MPDSLRSALRLLPLGALLLGGSLLLPACDGGDKNNKPAAAQNAGKKKGKKKKKKAKKTEAVTMAAAPAAGAAPTHEAQADEEGILTPPPEPQKALENAPETVPAAPITLPSEEAPATSLTAEEAARELDRCLSEIRCIEDSSLSEAEKAAVLNKLLPKATPIATAAGEAGGFAEIEKLWRQYKQSLLDSLMEAAQKHNIYIRELTLTSPYMPEAFKRYWMDWEGICKHYGLDPNRMMPTGHPKMAADFITACGGTVPEP